MVLKILKGLLLLDFLKATISAASHRVILTVLDSVCPSFRAHLCLVLTVYNANDCSKTKQSLTTIWQCSQNRNENSKQSVSVRWVVTKLFCAQLSATPPCN